MQGFMKVNCENSCQVRKITKKITKIKSVKEKSFSIVSRLRFWGILHLMRNPS